MSGVLLVLISLLACKTGGQPEPQDSPSDSVQDSAQDQPLSGSECAALSVAPDPQSPSGDCAVVESISEVPGVALKLRADCTDPQIQSGLSRRHLIMVPKKITRETLWLHIGGTGGRPSNTTHLGLAAMSQGYRYISIAYPNEDSIDTRCTCPEGPRPPECEELVRAELLYGREMTPWFEMDSPEAIVPRLEALLTYLAENDPSGGWEAYLDADGVVWENVSMSGFSQGGGMAGMIARDHELERVMYLSKGAGSVVNALIEAPIACEQQSDCERGDCCSMADLQCEQPPAQDAICVYQLPQPWASAGRDTDGDGLGDGSADSRATPGSRQFALIHRSEGAMEYSPQIFEGWGMGSDYVDADSVPPPYDDVQLWSTNLAPNSGCGAHQSMGSDACQPIDPNTSRPAMWEAWTWAMGVSLP